MMGILKYLPALLSSLFRLAIYIFLRIIPTSLAQFVLPPLYLAHLASWLLTPQPSPLSSSEKAHTSILVPEERPLQTLIFSLPTSSKRLRLSNLLINTLLFVAAVDFVLTPFLDTATDVVFTRVGAVYPDSVKILARYREFNTTDQEFHLRLIFREIRHPKPDFNPWSDGPVMNFKADNDWVDTKRLTGLWPNTPYEYTLSTLNNTLLAHRSSPIRFHTFPDPRLPTGNHYKFIVSSCMIPNHPYNGPLHHRTIRGFDLLANYLYPETAANEGLPTESSVDRNITTSPTAEPLQLQGPAEFLLFLGDFIYADVPVYIGDHQEPYRRLYRRNYQSDSFRKIYERLPVFHAYDDHEFTNNFGAASNDSTPPYLNAASAFKTYQSDANYDPSSPGEHYYDFQYGDSAFFVMDTRRHRTDIGVVDRTMLGDKQLASLQTWLSQVNRTSVFKFIITSVPFTSLWGHDAQADSWAGFPSEKQILLDAFHSVPNVILLSGDRHEFAAIEFNGEQPAHHPLWEFSTSPLSMFYIPFVRTLRLQSDLTVRKNRTKVELTENGMRTTSTLQDVPVEKVVKYIPAGNYKWSTIEINTMDFEKPSLSLEVMVDGKSSFILDIAGIPVKLQFSKALGAFVPSSIKDIVEKLGFHPKNWF